ncbi:LEC14B protein [Scenedesmus sp. PABB004]|nr:LEC14B protein [Scenedesmus sp. PABB004]
MELTSDGGDEYVPGPRDAAAGSGSGSELGGSSSSDDDDGEGVDALEVDAEQLLRDAGDSGSDGGEEDEEDEEEEEEAAAQEEDEAPLSRARLLRLLFGAARRSSQDHGRLFQRLTGRVEPLRGPLAAQLNANTSARDVGQAGPIWACLDTGFDSSLAPTHSTERQRQLLHEQQAPSLRALKRQRTAAAQARARAGEAPRDGDAAPDQQPAAPGGALTRAAARRAAEAAAGGGGGGGSGAGAGGVGGAPAPAPAGGGSGAGAGEAGGAATGFTLVNTAQMLIKREVSLGRNVGFSRAQQRHLACHRAFPLHPHKVRDSMPSRAYLGQYSDGGDFFVAAFQDRRVRLYDTAAGWRLRKDVTTRMTRWTITDSCLSPDNRLLVYASISPVAFVVNVGSSWDVVESAANITELHEPLAVDGSAAPPGAGAGGGAELGGGRDFGIWSIAWSPQGGQIIAGTNDRAVYVYDVESKACLARLTGHGDDVNAVAYLGGGSPHLLVSGSDDEMVRLWDVRVRSASGRNVRKPQGVLVGHVGGVTHVCARGDGVHVLSNSKDQTARLWDVRAALSAAAAADAARERPPLERWDYRWEENPASGYNVRHPRDVSLMAYRGHGVLQTLVRAYFSPAHTTGQRYVYAGSADGTVRAWDIVSGQQVAAFEYHRALVRDVSWHPYEAELTSVSWDGRVVSWGVEPPAGGPLQAAWRAKLVCKAAHERFRGATVISADCPELPLAAVQEAWRAVQGDGLKQLCKLATARAACGDVAGLAWLHGAGCAMDWGVGREAARAGQIAVLEWARDQGLCLHFVCEAAAKGGQRAVLRWARAQTPPVPWAGALRWLRANGCPWERDWCESAAADNGHEAMTAWIRAQPAAPDGWDSDEDEQEEGEGDDEVAAAAGWARGAREFAIANDRCPELAFRPRRLRARCPLPPPPYTMARRACRQVLLLALVALSAAAGAAAQGAKCGVAICFVIDASGSIGSTGFAQAKQFVVDVMNQTSAVADTEQFGASAFGTSAAPVKGLADMTSDTPAAIAAIKAMPYPASRTNMEAGLAGARRSMRTRARARAPRAGAHPPAGPRAAPAAGDPRAEPDRPGPRPAARPPACFNVTNGTRGGILTRNIDPALQRIVLLITDGNPNTKNTASPPNCTCKAEGINTPPTCVPSTQNCSDVSVQLRAGAITGDNITLISIGVGPSISKQFLLTLSPQYYPVADYSALQAAVADIVRGVCTDVGIAKSVTTAATQPVGGTFGFKLDISNAGKFNVSPPITFTDSLPPGLTYVTTPGVVPQGGAPPAVCAFNATAGQVRCVVNSTLPLAATWSYGLSANAATAGNWTNVADVAVALDNNVLNNQARAPVVVASNGTAPTANVALNMTAPAAPVPVNTPFNFTITVTSKGASTATNATMVDSLPPGLNCSAVTPGAPTCSLAAGVVSCSFGDMPVNTSATVVITCRAAAAGTYNNVAVANATNDAITGDNSDAANVFVYVPTCGVFNPSATSQGFPCTPPAVPNTDAANSTVVDAATCCKARAARRPRCVGAVRGMRRAARGGCPGRRRPDAPAAPRPARRQIVPANLPYVRITKVGPSSPVEVGAPFNFTITLTSESTTTAEAVTMVDDLPASLQPTAVSPTPECSIAGQKVSCSFGNMTTNATRVVTVTSVAQAAGTLSNTASSFIKGNVSASAATNVLTFVSTCGASTANGTKFQCPPDLVFNSAALGVSPANVTNCCVVPPNADLGLTKTGPADAVVGGSTFNFTLFVYSHGSQDATNSTLTDDFPTGLTPLSVSVAPSAFASACSIALQSLSCAFGTVKVGDNVTVTVTTRAAVVSDTITNTASVAASNDVVLSDNTAQATVGVFIASCGSADADQNRFKCPPGLIFNESAVAVSPPTNASCCMGAPDIKVTKTGPAGPVATNTSFAFTILVQNIGSGDATNVVLTDTLPPGLELISAVVARRRRAAPAVSCNTVPTGVDCPIGPLAAGASVAVTVTVRAGAESTYTNTAVATADNDPNPLNNQGQALVFVFAARCGNVDGANTQFTCPNGTIFNSSAIAVTPPSAAACCEPDNSGPGSNVKVTKSGPTNSVPVTSSFEFVMVVTSDGTAAAQGVTLSDPISPSFKPLYVVPSPECKLAGQTVSCAWASLAVGASATVRVGVEVLAAGTLGNVVTVDATNEPPNNKADNTDGVTVKTYTATCGTFTDTGAKYPCPNGTIFDNAQINNPNPSDPTCCTVPNVADLVVRKTGPTSLIAVGQDITYTIVVTNNGNAAANNAVLVDTLTAPLSPKSVTPSSCTIAGLVVTCALGSVPAGGSTTVTLVATASGAGTTPNNVAVSADNDVNPGNNQDIFYVSTYVPTCGAYSPTGEKWACPDDFVFNAAEFANTNPSNAVCCVAANRPRPDLAIVKTAPTAAVQVGTNFDYVIKLTNNGQVAATNTVITDLLPAGVTYVAVLLKSLPCIATPSGSQTLVTCNFGTLGAGESITITITVRADVEGTLFNSAYATADDGAYSGDDADSVNTFVYRPTCGAYTPSGGGFPCPPGFALNPATIDSPLTTLPNCCTLNINPASSASILVTKVGPGAAVPVGQEFDYTLTTLNDGLITVNNVVLVDDILDPLVAVKVVPRTACALVGARVTCNWGTLAPGASKVATVTVKAASAATVNNYATATGSAPGSVDVVSAGDAVLTLVFVPTCGAYNADNSRYSCPSGFIFNSAAVNKTGTPTAPLTTADCCIPTPSSVTVTLAKRASPRNTTVGSNVRFTITATATGGAATNVVVTDALPAGLDFVSVTPKACAFASGTVTCSFKSIAAGSSARITLTAKTTRAGRITNTASGTAAGAPVPPASTAITVTPAPANTGACCNPTTGACANGVAQTACAAPAVWTLNGVCGQSGVCLGACCTTAGKCLQTLASGCSGAVTWSYGAPCGNNTCKACTTAWTPCSPCVGAGCADPCCAGYSCQRLNKAGKIHTYYSGEAYRCLPLRQCGREGEVCGNCYRGSTCCDGLLCKWDYAAKIGYCRTPASSPCTKPGTQCTADGQCCPGCRCVSGVCKQAVCTKSCSYHSTHKCSVNDDKDCCAAAAAAASPPALAMSSAPAGKRRAGPTTRAQAAAAAGELQLAAQQLLGGAEAAPSPLPELSMPLVLHVLSFLPLALQAWTARLVCKAARERFHGATAVSLRCPELPLTAVQEAWRAVQGGGWERRWLVRARVACGDVAGLAWLRGAGCDLQHVVDEAVHHGQVAVLEWARDEGLDLRDVCYFAAAAGQLGVLRWARAQTPPLTWDEHVCAWAAWRGDVEMLRWARTQAEPARWAESVCEAAALHGHLEALRWLRANGCPWQRATCERVAALEGHEAVVAWIREQPE